MSHIRGRLGKDADKTMEAYTASIAYDWRLYPYDITGSIAHAGMLARQGIITREEAKKIVSGLEEIRGEIEQGRFEFKPELEDIHMNIEARLIELAGEAGEKLHTARSRNDQVALDMRLFAKDAADDIRRRITDFQSALVVLAAKHRNAAMPGYTHLQVAQPVLLAHHLLAYFEMLERDKARFADCKKRADVMPLGSGALAGVGYDIDREYVATKLGFGALSKNSLDAVADRDFILEFLASAGICMVHLSRLAEEIILWSSAEFAFIELDEAFAATSSIMPQKKNRDVAELARGKTGRVLGHLVALLTTMKGLPLAYNRDLQEDKEGLFDTVDTLGATLETFTGLISSLKVNRAGMSRALERGYVLATDLADYLVKKGLSFREAHRVVGALVLDAAGRNKSLQKLSLTEYKKHSPLFDRDVFEINVKMSLKARDITGGTAPAQVSRRLAEARRLIKKEQTLAVDKLARPKGRGGRSAV